MPSHHFAICSTFVAQPIGKSIQFWQRQLGVDEITVEFAAHNQLIQQLLDRNGVVRHLTSGVAVLLVRPEDWFHKVGTRALRAEVVTAAVAGLSDVISRTMFTATPGPML